MQDVLQIDATPGCVDDVRNVDFHELHVIIQLWIVCDVL